MLESPKKIIITGDIFRPNEYGDSAQNPNIIWLYEALKKQLKLATGRSVTNELFEKDMDSLTSKAFNLLKAKPTIESWTKLYCLESIDSLLQYIWLLFKGSLVVGFELPDILKRAFNLLNITYVDIVIHPVRFLNDIIFGISSNNKYVAQEISSFSIPEEVFHVEAGMVSATMSRLPRLNEIKGKTVIIAGQTSDDRSTVRDGKIVRLSSFRKEIYEACRSADTVLFKPHPYWYSQYDYDFLKVIRSDIQLITDNFYYLLSHEEISAVCSISSSTSIEAKYFDKSGIHFSKYEWTLSNDFCQHFDNSTQLYFAIDDFVFSADFWRNILASVCSVTAISGATVMKKENRLRNSLRSFWGYDFLNSIKV